MSESAKSLSDKQVLETKQFGADAVLLIAKILSNYLGCEFLNIDKFTPKNSLKLKVNETLYNKYKYNYIVSKNKEGISSRDIFINKIKKIKLL